jgi:hypothetical protein
MCGLWWTKQHWGRFSPSTSISPANHSTNFTIIIITRGWHNRPIGGRSAECAPNWTNFKGLRPGHPFFQSGPYFISYFAFVFEKQCHNLYVTLFRTSKEIRHFT